MPEITDAEFWRLFDSRLQAVTDDAYLAAFHSGARAGVALMGGAAQTLVDWDVINDAATAFLANNRLSTAAMTEITRRRVVSEFIEWQRSGKPLKNLISRLQPWFGKLRAKRIAVTETTRAYAYGNLTAWQSSGLVSAKRWYTARDERVCPLCGPMHGQIVMLDQNFRIIEEALPPKMRGKYAPVYAPPLHTNCRCWLQPVTDKALLDQQLKEALR